MAILVTRLVAVLSLAALGAPVSGAALGDEPPLAYSAEEVWVRNGVATRRHIWTDGVRTRNQDDDGKEGSYFDEGKDLYWIWGEKSGCRQMATAQGVVPTRVEEPAGQERVDGHPTKKARVTTTVVQDGKTTTDVLYVWRATDLGGLVIRSRAADGSSEMTLRDIRLGPPDPRLLSLPDPHCHYDEMKDTSRDAAQAPGGHRTIRFSDAACKQMVPLPLTLSIPSDYAIRSGGRLRGCFWGAPDDLDRVLASAEEVDFGAIRRGVFWCRISPATDFDFVHSKFVSEQGPQEQWPAAMKAMGAENVDLAPLTVGGIATLRVSAVMNGERLYMLYIGYGDSPAVLINYKPAGKGGAADDVEWRRFLDSLQPAK